MSKIRVRAVSDQAILLLAAMKVDPQRSSGHSRYLGAALRFTVAVSPRRNKTARYYRRGRGA
jgi:hypothetical protein